MHLRWDMGRLTFDIRREAAFLTVPFQCDPKAAGTIVCESETSSITLAGSVNYDTIKVQYGPRPSQV